MLEQRMLLDELKQMETMMPNEVFDEWKHKLEGYEKLLNELIYGYSIFFL